MKNKPGVFIAAFLFCLSQSRAQVPVSQEPFHHLVFQNKYVRILDVLIPPNDTSQFHIHSIPSLFVYFTNTNIASQIKGKDWVKSVSESGKARYTSYTPDTPDILIHRVTNSDSLPFHVNDIEILSPYNAGNVNKVNPLHFPMLLENEKSFAYRLTNREIKTDTIKLHGPLIAELITGDKVFLHNPVKNTSQEIKAGKFLYVEPNIPFYFTATGTSEINLIVFEIK